MNSRFSRLIINFNIMEKITISIISVPTDLVTSGYGNRLSISGSLKSSGYFTNRIFVFKSENKNKLLEAFKFLMSRVSTLLIEMLYNMFILLMS